MSAPEIRIATPADVTEVSRLLAGFRDYYGESEPRLPDIEAVVDRLLGDHSCVFFLAARSLAEPAFGIAQLRFRLSAWTGSEDAWLEDLFVEDSVRGSGAGRMLTQACIDFAKGRGCKRLQLDCSEGNPRAIGLYESLGFTTGTEDRFEGARNLYFTKPL